MAKLKTVEGLASAIHEILGAYADDVNEVTKEAVVAVTKAGVSTLKGESKRKFNGSGNYASGWTSRVETNRLSSQGILYNGKLPGLPHLLEHGHAKRGGGRVSGRVHIAPVEEQLTAAFKRKLEENL